MKISGRVVWAVVLLFCTLAAATTPAWSQTSRPKWMGESALQSMLTRPDLKGYLELADSRLLWIDAERYTIRSFDFAGNLMGETELDYSMRTEKRFINSVQPRQNNMLITEDRAYLSMRGRIHIWNLPSGELVQTVEFDRPVRLLKPLPDDTLIIVAPEDRSLFLVADRDGHVLSRFGEKLVIPVNPDNEGFNDFFALDAGERIFVLFQKYPIYQVYSTEGELIEQGRYGQGLHQPDENPPLEEVARATSSYSSQFDLLSIVEYSNERVYWVTGDAEAGILDDKFQVLYWRVISDLKSGFVPKVMGIDARNERLLIRQRRLGDATKRLDEFGALGYLAIRE